MPTDLDAKVDGLIQKASDVKSGDVGFVWKMAGGFLMACVMAWMKYQLGKKSDELAKARTELELTKMKAHQDLVAAQVEAAAEKRYELEKSAADHRDRAIAEEARIAEEAAAHEVRLAKIRAVEADDWDTLNKLAGIK